MPTEITQKSFIFTHNTFHLLSKHINHKNIYEHMSRQITFHQHYTQKHVFIYLGFYVAFNTGQVISRWVVGRAEENSTYSSLRLCTVNCRPTATNYQLSHLRPSRGSNPGLRGGRRECYHSATVRNQLI